ncbi:MAG: FAD-binding oxidoreductase [Acidobacteriota bacterium]|nr:FAD-binding oxidoreductase [Acidobacteriota bacterium]MDE3093776.1 FAD-binding oxidoreductase [Acidobacteriota bacterium]MDE3146447.1 FAD-binding oxidoreductase [Acidobacteriota bacterium]
MTTPAPGSEVDRSEVDEVTRQVLSDQLSRAVRGEVRFDAATRAMYATDSSNYRQVPLGVVFPRDEDDVVRTVEICARHRAPILGRGAGTSLAGQACNVAVVIDMSRHMNQILEIDPERRLARVQPGVVLDRLNEAARALDLTFGPDPATHAWCTIGGMVGNNSCGTHALRYGKTVDNVEELRIVTVDGVRMRLGAGGLAAADAVTADATPGGETDAAGHAARIVGELRRLRDDFATPIATGYPALERRVSGYNLDALLEENGFHLARALVGSESTCALVTEITVTLSPWPRQRVLVVLGYRDIYAAADDVPRLLGFDLIGLEGFDATLVEQMRRADLNVEHLGLLPPGGGWLLCEVGADDLGEAEDIARAILASLDPEVSAEVFVDDATQRRVWQIRESGLGATARPVDQPANYEGWEDAAVEPANLGRYLRGVKDLWDEFGLSGAWYGHFGQGCVHTRNNFDLASVEGLSRYREFVERAADLCVALGGSISGEHGDGQSRGELLTRMYSPALMEAFGRFKSIWDPQGRMNPGKLIDAYPLDTNLRHGPRYRSANLLATGFAFAQDHGSFQEALERCVGVGKCRSDGAGVMCPSYRVTREEKHSTRGRAKLLGELFQGATIPATWKSDEVFDALDLCLSCKGCASDCPTHVDMATYKSEFLSHYYRGRLRPRATYALSLLPWSGRVASRVPRLANALLQNPLSRGVMMRVAGLSTLRRAPVFARRSARRDPSVRRRGDDLAASVVVWPDTFSDLFSPERVRTSVEVLEFAGERVAIPRRWACCGRTLYDAGMLDRARASASRVLDVLSPYLEKGVPVVVVEPSCLAAFRDEFVGLLAHDPRAARLASLSRSLAEHLDTLEWSPPDPVSRGRVSVHPHCHQRATGGSGAEANVLTRLGYAVDVLDLGCCGLAGSFGYERHHDELSREIARDRFLPGLAAAAEKGPLLLDGFSCELQAHHLSDLTTTSFAELVHRVVVDRATAT